MIDKSFKGYIHAGAHKTASSFLQDNLRLNSKRLKSSDNLSVFLNSGVFHDKFLPNYKALINNSIAAGKLLIESPEYIQAYETLNELVTRKIVKKFIFSDERILGAMIGYTNTLYPGAEYAAEFLSQVTRKMNIKILLYIRNQADFLESCYLQYYRETGSECSFEDFKERIDFDSLSWKPLVSSFVKFFGDDSVKLISYESSKQGNREFVKTFFNSFSSLEDFEVKESIVNPRFSQKAMSIFGVVKPLMTQEEAFKFQSLLKELFPVGEKYPSPTLFTKEEKNKILEQYNDENIELLEKYK